MKTLLLFLISSICLLTGPFVKSKSHNDHLKKVAHVNYPMTVDPASLNLNYDEIIGEVAMRKFGNSTYKVLKVEKLYEKGNSNVLYIAYTNMEGLTYHVACFKNLKIVNNQLIPTKTEEFDKEYCAGDCQCDMNVTVTPTGNVSAYCTACTGSCRLVGEISN